MKLYQDFAQNEAGLNQVVKKLFLRCYKTHQTTQTIVQIFKNFQKHKTANETLMKLGMHVHKPGFDISKVKQLVEFWVGHASQLCKQIHVLIKDEALPLHEDEQNKERFLFQGKDMRVKIVNDVTRMRQMMEGLVEVAIFDNKGKFIQ